MKIRYNLIAMLTIAFALNFIIIVGHFNEAVVPKLENAVENNHNQLTLHLKDLEAEIQATGDLEGSINIFTEKHEIDIVAAKLDIFVADTELQLETREHHISKIIFYEGEYYIIKAKGNVQKEFIPAIDSFVLVSTAAIFALTVIFFIFIELTVTQPIKRLQDSITNYKFGIKPELVKGTSEAKIIQNSFVNLVGQLEEEKEKQNRIIASISHDIKTPLTAILGYSYRVTNEQLTKERRMEYMDRVHRKAEALKELTDEFDDYLSCNMATNLKEVKLGVLLQMIEDDFKEDLAEKNIKLVINSNVDKDTPLNIDLGKIKRIFSNTISNSVRHMDSFGKIIIDVRNDKNYVEFSITDTGPGVPEENLKKIFEPLFTSDPSRKISGLGLAICQDIVLRHGGFIRAENCPNAGLSIIFTIEK